MTKQSAFERSFSKVIHFEVWDWVISRLQFPTKEEAIVIYQKELGEWGRDQIVTAEDIREDWVRFTGGQDDDGEFINCWWLYQEGKKGAKPVWVFTPLK
jgi:hypothetical protein